MKRSIRKLNAFAKGFVLFIKPHIYLGWAQHFYKSFANTLALSKWISDNSSGMLINDFYAPKRNYSKRFKMFELIVEHFQLANKPVNYLEFGVSAGDSFRWWLKHLNHADTMLYGFDTFEGLPEAWGNFKKGAMDANIPVIDDKRALFIEGLFQQSLPPFLANNTISKEQFKIIHFDADLFSSTLFAITSLAPYLNKGDILLFDEFNVPNHEFLAFKMFQESYYFNFKVIGAVNNYYQVAMVVE